MKPCCERDHDGDGDCDVHRNSHMYLGDGVHVAKDYLTGGLILTTNNGIRATNSIVLEPDVLVAFVEYIERMVERRKPG